MIFSSDRKNNFLAAWLVFLGLYSALVEKYTRSFYSVGIGVLIAVIDYSLDTRLNDSLGALVAGEKRNI